MTASWSAVNCCAECQAELDAAKKAAQAEPEDYDAKIAQGGKPHPG